MARTARAEWPASFHRTLRPSNDSLKGHRRTAPDPRLAISQRSGSSLDAAAHGRGNFFAGFPGQSARFFPLVEFPHVVLGQLLITCASTCTDCQVVSFTNRGETKSRRRGRTPTTARFSRSTSSPASCVRLVLTGSTVKGTRAPIEHLQRATRRHKLTHNLHRCKRPVSHRHTRVDSHISSQNTLRPP